MRHVLIFTTYPGGDIDYLTNSRLEDGPVYRGLYTKIELLPRGTMDYELRIDAVPIGQLVAIVRDRADEVPPETPQ